MLKRESKSKAPAPRRMASDDLSSATPADDSVELDQRVEQHLSSTRQRRGASASGPSTSKQAASARPAAARPRPGRKGSITRQGPAGRAGPAAAKRKGGLFGRLKSMRKKEGEDVDPESADEYISESDEATEVPVDRGISQPSYPSPRETLGISAFQRTRASTSPSAVTGPLTNEDDLESTMSPLRAVAAPNGASKGKEPMRLKDSGPAKQPDLVDKPKVRKVNPKRYSIAQSVEASLVGPSWSVADRGQAEDEDEDDEDEDDDEDEEDEEEDDGLDEENYRTDDESRYSPSYWLKDDAGPPMVEGSVTSDWSRVRRAYEEDYDANTVTTQAPSNADRRRSVVSDGKGKKKKKSESFYAVEVAGVGGKRRSRKMSVDNDDDDEAAHSVVNRLLAKLEADGAEEDEDVDLAAAPISVPVNSDSRKANGDARKGRGAQGTSLFMPAIAPSVVYGGGDETLIMPDDSVSIRAARRFQQEQDPESRTPQLADPRIAAGRQAMAKPQSAQQLAAAFAALEPAFIDDEEEDDIEYEQERSMAGGAMTPSYDDRSVDGKDDYTEYDNEFYDDDGFTESYPPASPRSFRPPRSPRRSRGQHSRQVSGVTSESFLSEPRSAKRVSNRRRKADRQRNEFGRETWLMESALTPEQLHYLVKAMVGVELEWELQRTFAFDPARSSSAYHNHRQPPPKGREYAIFRNRELSRDDLPQLPLVRFLYDTAFVMLPIFGGGQTPYPRRRAHADAFWKRAVSPMLRLLQSRSLSKRVDRYGEGDGGPFSAQSTLDVLAKSVRQIAVRYITATLQVGDGNVKESWPWPSANMMRLPAFTPYRIPLDRQTRGAYEVDVVFVRAQGSQTGYIMTVKKNNGQPHHYVMRTEQQFRDFAKAISSALPKACIKQPPAMEMAQMPGHFRELIRTVDQATVNGSSPDLPAPVAKQLQKLGGGSTAELGKRSSKADLKAANAAKQDEAIKSTPKLGRIAALKAELRREIRQEINRAKGIPNEENANGARNGSDPNERPSNGGAGEQRRPSLSDSRASFAMSSTTSDIYDNTPATNDSRATLVDPPAYTSSRNNFGGLFGKRKDDGINYEARRLQLRDWLRDALSARGVGHHSETQAFLGGKTSFTDRDLKKSTKETMEANRRADEESSGQRQEVATQAGEEVLDLRDMLEEMWEDCKFSDGFLQAKEVFEEAESFASLPEDYQGVVSYLHLKAARMLDGIFITGSHSAANFRRAKAGFKSIPWKLLTVVMAEPTGMMVNDLKRILTHPSFVTRMTSAVMDDDPKRVEEGLAELKRRLPSDYLRKLRKFVESTPDDVKRVIRDQAEKAGIPLVSAILRGNDAPLLQGRHLQVIVGATKMYQALIDSEPTMLDIEMAARKSREIGLIRDLQHALRLYSARRDGQHLRDIIRSTAFRASFATFVQPILDYIAKLHHRGRPLKEAIRTMRVRTESLLELIEALRSRVQDPARNIDALTTFFDSHAQDTVGIISALTPLFPWLHILAHTVGEGSYDLAREWPLPPGMSGSLYPLEGGPLNNLKNIAEAAWLKRIRQMEVCSRWIAGDIEADQDIQVLGGEGEQSRTRQILPEEPLQQKLDRRSFKPFISGFREALTAVLESR